MSEAHSRYEPLPSKDLRLLITGAMLFASPMTYFNALFGRYSMISDSCDGEGSTSTRLLYTQKYLAAVLDGLRLV